ncbi:A-kinase-interacting protein 1 isoform X1 [Phacochoerus africanus]|uniref:A-kinase-interacting protein 1 isoform X1 n=1 Tax=Phacochoerus africanus TaxID=41426 RepID=UPI001FD8795A|nr:A-kinase-interacting protein 1 isoform X1 [Phacochoerus africanus]XP_047608892.1 A-kinase-interacting protein 1 isoform X1 [Phacochoerus africanus]
MESCLVAAALNGVDRRSLQRSARLAREVLERARRRAVDWRSVELPKGSVGVISRELPCRETGLAAGPQRLLPGEREERLPTLSASFRTMAEFMDYTSSQCGKYCSSLPEEGGSAHAYRYHRGRSELRLGPDPGSGQRNPASLGVRGSCQASECVLGVSRPAEPVSKDLYIEVYPGTYSVTVGADDLTRKTHVVAVDSGQSVDLVFPV